jgi:hypothetical protein
MARAHLSQSPGIPEPRFWRFGPFAAVGLAGASLSLRRDHGPADIQQRRRFHGVDLEKSANHITFQQ